MTQSKNNNIAPDGKRRIRRAYGIFFPFWPIYFYGASRLIPTLAVTLLLDSAFLIAVLLLFSAARRGTAGGDVGNIWRRKILPFYLCDLAGSFLGGGILRLSVLLLPEIFGVDKAYYAETAAKCPLTDLRTMIPLLLSIFLAGAAVYLLCSRAVFRRERHGRAISMVLALISAPYSMLIPTLFEK